jgi:drug/metabolite transporter (DMT)-like permease
VGLILSADSYTSGNLIGDSLSLIAAFFYATYLVFISRLGEEDALSIIFYTSLFCCIFSLPVALIESPQILPPSIDEWINLFLLALIMPSWWPVYDYLQYCQNFSLSWVYWVVITTL